ncbi:hypothetical protein CPB84DRAFT_273925 [Gymnopilus junonius]|uniref:Uncharacterized protein n=1 Tax=Gymnopilus junonius TaxID=109634 RepID=A0A9P5NWJ2_GYMJU|nr:hypothetical protein CPB84DRAFT_273925 [Gymnopilus junonius]
MSDVLDSAADLTSTPISTPASALTDGEVAESKDVEENSTPEPSAETQPNTIITTAEAGSSSSSSSSQPTTKGYATTAEAIANFRPTSHEVVKGIAPHVFDERKRRRSHPRSGSRSPKPYWYAAGSGERRPSPLRGGATVIAWDEHSIYLGERLRFFCLVDCDSLVLINLPTM